MKFITPFYLILGLIALNLHAQEAEELPAPPAVEEAPPPPEEVPTRELRVDAFESTEGYEDIDFRGFAIEFPTDDKPYLVVLGEIEQTLKYDVRVVPQLLAEGEEIPDYWAIHVLGKPFDEPKTEKPKHPVWIVRLSLKEYSTPIRDETVNKVVGEISRITGRQYKQPTFPIVGKKGIELIGKGKSIRIEIRSRDNDAQTAE